MNFTPNKKHLVFDIDQCLVDISLNPQAVIDLKNDARRSNNVSSRKQFVSFEIPLSRTEIYSMAGYKRPYLKEFMEYCQDNFEVHVWSAGDPKYVHKCVDHIFKDLKRPNIILTNEDIVKRGDEYHKPLSKIFAIVPSANETNTILIDDRSDNFIAFPKNGVHIPRYKVSPGENNTIVEDENILLLTRWLKSPEFVNCKDVRTLDKSKIFSANPSIETVSFNYNPSSRKSVSIARKLNYMKVDVI